MEYTFYSGAGVFGLAPRRRIVLNLSMFCPRSKVFENATARPDRQVDRWSYMEEGVMGTTSCVIGILYKEYTF